MAATIRFERAGGASSSWLRFGAFSLVGVAALVAAGALSQLSAALVAVGPPRLAADRAPAQVAPQAAAGTASAIRSVPSQPAQAGLDSSASLLSVTGQSPVDERRLDSVTSTTTSAAVTATVVSLQGRGQLRSQSFAVDDSWAISWEHRGSHLFSIQVIPAGGGGYGDLIVSQTGPTTGETPMYVSGRFTLRVMAPDAWSVRVVDLGARPTGAFPDTINGSGATNTAIFSPNQPWLVEWSLDRRSSIGIDLVPLAKGRFATVLVDPIASQAGCATVSDVGAFYLSIATSATWRLRVSALDGEMVCPLP